VTNAHNTAAVGARRPSVGVLTFHRCINYGSYWQARCLVEGLKSRGIDPVLLEHRSSRVNRREWSTALSPTPAPQTPEHRRLYHRKIRLFLEAFETTLPLTPAFPLDDPPAAQGFAALVVGSDEVWNFRHPWYGAQPLFFGEARGVRRLIAYAASFGNHDATDGLGREWAERLKRFAYLSVRDGNSQRLIAGALGDRPPVVLDPCLQFPSVARRRDTHSGEILLYGHGFPRWFQNAVRAFAKAVRAPIVSFGYHNDWADEERIAEGPEAFARAMGAARAVVTNFFHGCVFSVINGRPFVTTLSDYRFNKVQDLLLRLELQSRLMTPESLPSDYGSALSAPPDSKAVLGLLRKASDRFLDQSLAGL